MFETYFGLRSFEEAPRNDKIAFLTDESGSMIALFKVGDATYPKIFHVGFMRGSVEEVRRLHGKLKEGGSEPEEPRQDHGRFTVYFKAPGGFTVEVNSMQEAEAKAD